MGLSTSVRQRAGVLADAAELFAAQWLGNDCKLSGGDGLVALCRAVQQFVYVPDVDEETERRFVEGAGALLGVLLIEHIDGASHVGRAGAHRVRLSAHGFFDPFAAMDSVLDAQDIRGELRRQVQLAEAEAAARGPVSRVVSALHSALLRERPELAIEEQFDCMLSLRDRRRDESLQLDLKRAVESTRDQDDEAVQRVTRRLLSLLPGAPETPQLSASEFEQRVLPRIARADAVRDLSSQGKTTLLSHPLSAELVVAFVLEYEGRARYVRSSEVEELAMGAADALGCAVRNLRARSDRARVVREPCVEGFMLVARSGDGRDSARVLLTELFDELSVRLGPSICLAIPHRDTFFACAADQPHVTRQVAQRASEDHARAPHALSSRLYRLTPAGLQE